MKKYIFNTVLCSALALSLTTSCELDQFPDGTIPSEKSWEKVSDAQKFYNGLLASLRSNSASADRFVTEAQADLFNAMKGTPSLLREHEWNFTTSQFSGDANWVGNFTLITDANNILNNIDKVPYHNAEDSTILANIKGAAYFARALAYSNMVPRYCVNYENKDQAEKALGLPLLTTVDVNAKPSRSNLEKTYQFILEDIKQAEKMVKEGDFTEPNQGAVTALKARVLLNKKDYAEAEKAATSLFSTFPLTEADAYADLWLLDQGSEIIFQPIMTVEERIAHGGVFINYDHSNEAWCPAYVPTQGLMNLYEADDVRTSTFFMEVDLTSRQDMATGMMFVKYQGNPELRKGGEDEYNFWANMFKVFRTSEMYLIAAEAALYKENPDEAAALNYLNTLRAKRNATALKTSGQQLILDMKQEWIREMVGEGFRLDCLKRWNQGIKRMKAQNFSASLLVNTPAQSYTELNVQPGSDLYYKIIWEVPARDSQANGNLEGNWPKE